MYSSEDGRQFDMPDLRAGFSLMCSAVSSRTATAVPRVRLRTAPLSVRTLRQPARPAPEDGPAVRVTRLQDAGHVQLPE